MSTAEDRSRGSRRDSDAGGVSRHQALARVEKQHLKEVSHLSLYAKRKYSLVFGVLGDVNNTWAATNSFIRKNI